MRRREFITLLGGTAAAWPFAVRAQQSGGVRHIGVLMSTAADDSLGQAWSAAFAQGLQQSGWEIGGNLRIEYRWGAGDTERFRKYAAELVAARRPVAAAHGKLIRSPQSPTAEKLAAVATFAVTGYASVLAITATKKE